MKNLASIYIFIVLFVNISFLSLNAQNQSNSNWNAKKIFPVKHIEQNGKIVTVQETTDTTLYYDMKKYDEESKRKYIPEINKSEIQKNRQKMILYEAIKPTEK